MTAMKLGQELWAGFLDLLFPGPDHCPLCCRTLAPEDYPPCGKCHEQVKPVPEPYCEICGQPLDGSRNCSRCRGRARPFVQARACGMYEGVLRECLHRFKYQRDTSLLPYFHSLMAATLDYIRHPEVDLVIPVPLHWRREWERGFNQAALLARGAAAHLERPLVTGVLVRRLPTPPASGLSKGQRETVLAEVFACRGRVPSGKRVLLVDDIFTTGATAAACTRALLAGGAREVYVFTVATVGKHQ